MANTINVSIVQTANTFDFWRIRDNLQANDVNEIARGNFVKPTGNVTITDGFLLLDKGTGTTLTVDANARISGLLSVDSIDSDQDGYISLQSGNIAMSNRASGALFQANINTKFDGANVEFSNANVFFSNASATGLITITPNTQLLRNVTVTGTMNVVQNAHFTGNTTNVTGNLIVTGQTVNVSNLLNVATGNIVTANVGTLNVAAVGALANIRLANIANLVSTNTISTELTSTDLTATNTITVNANVTSILNVFVANITNTFASNIRIDSNPLHFIQNGNAVFNDMQVRGNLTVLGSTVNDTDTLVLRQNVANDGDGIFRIKRGSTGIGNAELRFNSISAVWQATANANGSPTHLTILTTSNLDDTVVSTSIINVASANSVKTAYDQATSARDTANGAYAQANGAYGQANGAYGQANGAYGQANGAYGQANGAYTAANTANTNALNAYAQANTSYGQANDAYTAANTANTNALNAYAQANTARDQANTARDQANTARGQANTAYAQANAAYADANTRVLKAGDTMTGNLIVSGATINTSTANISTLVTGNILTLSTGTGSNSNVVISANGSEIVRMTNTGNVGIGTTAPTSKLHIVGLTTIEEIIEKANITSTAMGANSTIDVLDCAVHYYTANSTANTTLNIRGNSTVTLNSVMSTNQTLTLAFMITNGTTPYRVANVQLDAVNTTIQWTDGSAPTASANSTEVYGFTVIKTAANAQYTLLGVKSRFAAP